MSLTLTKNNAAIKVFSGPELLIHDEENGECDLIEQNRKSVQQHGTGITILYP